jgi:cytoskeletal protein CcmA (bactofilin family)
VEEKRTRAWKSFGIPLGQAESAEPQETGPATEPAAEPISGTFIESGALFEGTLTLKGDFRIDSEFRGELATDGVIVIGPSGSVEGDIKARQVEIQGSVVGNVNARRLFILRASGRLHGDVESACIEIERHGFFQGGTRMTRPQAASLPSAVDDALAPSPAAPHPPLV